MIIKALKTLIAAAAAAIALTGPAFADTWSFSYFDVTPPGPSVPAFGHGTFTSESALSPYLLTGITGWANGESIAALSGYAGANNRLYFPGNPNVTDFGGISFSTVQGTYWNLFYNNGDFAIKSTVDPVGYAGSGTPIQLRMCSLPGTDRQRGSSFVSETSRLCFVSHI